MKTILITGGSGLVGRALSELLVEKGYGVIWLSRERFVKAEIPRYRWDYQKGEIDEEALQKADIIVHLAGTNLSDDPWTRLQKQRIVESRVQSARLIFDTLKKMGKKPEAFISASAIGIYGKETSKTIFDETMPSEKSDFLSRTCRKWEAEAQRFSDELGVRTVMIRAGFVLSHKSEAFKKMATPARYGLAAPIGNGRQYISWIHINDLCGIYLKAIENETVRGAYNAVAPDFIVNRKFMKKLARTLKRPFFIPRVPSFLMRLIFGESADMILSGSRVSSQKIQDAGYDFGFKKVKEAFRDCIEKDNAEKEAKRKR